MKMMKSRCLKLEITSSAGKGFGGNAADKIYFLEQLRSRCEENESRALSFPLIRENE